jgi:hypothetical protein
MQRSLPMETSKHVERPCCQEMVLLFSSFQPVIHPQNLDFYPTQTVFQGHDICTLNVTFIAGQLNGN